MWWRWKKQIKQEERARIEAILTSDHVHDGNRELARLLASTTSVDFGMAIALLMSVPKPVSLEDRMELTEWRHDSGPDPAKVMANLIVEAGKMRRGETEPTPAESAVAALRVLLHR